MHTEHNSGQIVDPTVGAWYEAKGMHECFKVVACDKNDQVEIQYFDGDIEEIEFDTWLSLHPHEIAEPEDASAPYELEREDMLNLLNEIENEANLDDYLDHLDRDDF